MSDQKNNTSYSFNQKKNLSKLAASHPLFKFRH